MEIDDSPVNTDHLNAFIERIERLSEELDGMKSDLRDIYSEAKGHGFDTKIIRKIVALRKQDRDERHEEEVILNLYKEALGID